jgi:hypothetical protein
MTQERIPLTEREKALENLQEVVFKHLTDVSLQGSFDLARNAAMRAIGYANQCSYHPMLSAFESFVLDSGLVLNDLKRAGEAQVEVYRFQQAVENEIVAALLQKCDCKEK